MYSAHPGTAGYVVTRKGAERLLALEWGYEHALDGALFEPKSRLFRDLVVYQSDPGLVIQADVLAQAALPAHLESDLEDERRVRKARRTEGAVPYTLDKLDSFVKDVRRFVRHRCIAALRGRHMRAVEFAGAGE
jgi:glycosyl transferase family 25